MPRNLLRDAPISFERTGDAKEHRGTRTFVCVRAWLEAIRKHEHGPFRSGLSQGGGQLAGPHSGVHGGPLTIRFIACRFRGITGKEAACVPCAALSKCAHIPAFA
jgi:hypothetical protein